jgi:hypothetical protein
MYTIYNKEFKNAALIMQKGFESLNLNMSTFAVKMYGMRSKVLHCSETINLENNRGGNNVLRQWVSVEVEPRCISVWKEQWAKRSARVTLLVDFDDQFIIVIDPSNGFWFLPGGGVEPN